MITYLRHLDIDDLIVLSSLLQPDLRLSYIAKALGITPPALSHRMHKYKEHIPNFKAPIIKIKGKIRLAPLNEETTKICLKAKQALEALSSVEEAA